MASSRSPRRPRTTRLEAPLLLEDRVVPAVYTVSGFADEPGLGTITPDGANFTASSLRAALQAANATSADDTIILPAGTYDLTVAGLDENAAYGDLDINATMYGGRLTISGADKTTTIIRANYGTLGQFQTFHDRIFDVHEGANASISGVTIRDGSIDPSDFNLGAGILLRGSFIQGTSTQLTLDSVIVTENIAATTASGASQGGGILVSAGDATLTVQNSTISKNVVNGQAASGPGINALGGGIASLTGFGSKSLITITDSTISDNIVRTADYPARFGGGSGAARGGGLYLEGEAVILRSTISGNQAISGDTGSQFGFGYSGDASGGGIHAVSTLTLTNSTVSGNSVVTGDVDPNQAYGGFAGTADGGGISSYGGESGAGAAKISNSTIVNNTATGGTFGATSGAANGGGIFRFFSTVAVTSNIVQGNTVSGGTGTAGNDLAGTLTSGGNNLIGDATGFTGLTDGVNGDQVGVADPVVGPLAANGGPTLTHLPILGGRAIDTGSNPSSLVTDQRGASRTLGVATDVGAVELPATTATVVTSSLNPSIFGDSVTFTATVTGTGTSPVLTGSIVFTIDGTPFAPITLDSAGQASFTTSTLAVGSHPVLADYSGDANYAPSASGSLTQIVNAPPPPPNAPPQASADSHSVVSGNTLTINAPGILSNDTDADGDTLTAVLGQNVPAGDGTLTLNTDGSFTFVPAANFTGTTTFTYFANDGTVNSEETTVTITVTPPPNAPPQASADSHSVVSGNTLTINAPGVLSNDTDADGDALTAVLGQNVPAGDGTLSLNTDGSFTFVPAANFVGTTTFTYFANDGSANSGETTVTLTVTPPPLPPVLPPPVEPPQAIADAYTGFAGTPLVVLVPGVLGNDSDADGDALTAVLGRNVPAGDGTLSLNADGSFRFVPAANFVGTTTFTYFANDGSANSAETTVTLTVTPPPLPPVLPPPVEPPVLPPPLPPPQEGVRRFVVGAGAGGSPRVRVFDENGVNRGDFFAFEESFLGGVRVATGDLNGDGVEDIVVAAGVGGGPRVSVFDGKSNERLADFFAYEPDFRGGLFVDVGDLDHDGVAEIVTGVGSGGGPRVRAFQLDGKVVQDFYAFDPSSASGVRVAVGNVVGADDSGDEIVATQGLSGQGQILILDGITRAVVQSFSSPDLQNYRGGQFVTVAGRSIVVGVDSVPDFANSVFAKLFPDLTPAEVTRVPEVQIFTPESLAKSGPGIIMNNLPTSVLTPSQSFSAYDDRDLSGVRVAGAKGTDFDFITARGSSENGSVIRLWKIVDGHATLVREFPAFEAGFIGSVYVGG